MKLKNLFLLFMGIFLVLSFVSASGYTYSNPSLTYGRTQSAFATTETDTFNSAMCQEGQDFILQIDPLGCEPAIVRSDLLEEQDVPVFCEINALKINPLMDLDVISSMSFGGDYPPEVRTVGFYPSRAALGQNDRLNNMYSQGIGYAMIMLRANPNESSMPDFVSGNLTATIKYDINNAFGIRDSSFYLPVLDEEDWENRMVQYGFWQGRGYVRAEDVTNDRATIAVYSDRYQTSFGEGNAGSNTKDKMGSFNLGIGEKTNKLFLPGFDCVAGLQLRLDSIQNADTFVRLKVNSDYLEVKEGEKFLDNKCRIRKISKEGLGQEVEIYCQQDISSNTQNTFELSIAPRVQLQVNGDFAEFSVGDYLYSKGDKHVYLGYIDSESGAANPEDIYVYLVAITEKLEGRNGESDLDQTTLNSVSSYARAMKVELGEDNLGRKTLDLLEKTTAGVVEVGKSFVIGESIYPIFKNEGSKEVLGETVRVVDFAGAVNKELNNATFSEYYELAQEDYLEIKKSFAKDKYPDTEEYFTGEKALYNLTKLAKETFQNKDVLDFCEKYDEIYPDSDYMVKERRDLCEDKYFSSSLGIRTNDVLIDGNFYEISLDGISEPKADDFGIDVWVKGPSGFSESYVLRKNQVLYLDDFRKPEDQIFIKSLIVREGTKSPVDVSFSFVGGIWKWRLSDSVDWKDLLYDRGTIGLRNDQVAVLFSKELRSLNFEKGRDFILSREGREDQVREYIQLLDLTQETATLDVNLKQSGTYDDTKKLFTSIKKVLDEDETWVSRNGDYTIIVKEINLKQYAKVSLLSNINRASSEANFSFNIGVEKRLIQLSPEKAAKRIISLNKTVNTLEKISKTLGVVVDVFDKSCQAVGAALTIKNLVTNAQGKSIARKEVMTSVGGWNDYCEGYETLVKEKTGKAYISIEDCLFDNGNKIDEDVEKFYTVMEAQNKNAQRIEGLESVTVVSGTFGDKKVNTDEYMKVYSEDVLKDLGDISNPDKAEIFSREELSKLLSYDSWTKNSYSLNQLKKIELYSELLKEPSLDSRKEKEYKKILFNVVSDINKNAESYLGRSNVADSLEIDSSKIEFLKIGEDLKEISYSGLRAKNLNIEPFKSLSGNPPVQVLYGTDANKYIVILQDSKKDEMAIARDGKDKDQLMIFSSSGERLVKYPSEFSKIYFKKYDEKSYENSYKVTPKVSYHETEPYKGLPAVVPFDTKNGWYAFVEATLPTGRALQSYGSSGAVSSFWVCNIGENRLMDGGPGKGDDICRLINKGTGQIYNQFPGLKEDKASVIIRKAENAIIDASKHREGSSSVKILEETFKIGSPFVGESGLECTDFMSPNDCKLLFNVCDPVVCPADRCDFGGAYPVKDVVQSGIIGSVALCLPNAKEGIKVPVCLSGVEAGVDSLISVFRSYQSCLQESIDTGKTVGICDEIHSIYLCEFLWKQAIPLGKVAIPKLTSLILGQNVRGGGAYSGFQAAWKNAKDSVSFFTDFYAVNSFNAFKARSTEEVGGAVCKNFISVVYPNKFGNLGDLSLTYSPVQFNARFEEIPFTTVTNPPVSQYKVYFHIYAGKDRGAYYNVWLRGDEGSTFYQGTGGRTVGSDYIPVGEYASETVDFTAPSGFKELCVSVNGQQECGFGKVTTSFASDWLKDQYVKSQVTDFDVSTEAECISGSRNWYNLLNPNIQAGAENFIDPAIYNDAIIRTCATDNPGQGSDTFAGQGDKSRWIEVGICGDENIKCYLDTQSVDRAAEFETTKKEISKEIGEQFVDKLKAESLTLIEFENKLTEINNEGDSEKKIGLINSIFMKVYNNNQKAHLLFLRGNVYGDLTKGVYGEIILQRAIDDCEEDRKELGYTEEDYNCTKKEDREEIDDLWRERFEVEEEEDEDAITQGTLSLPGGETCEGNVPEEILAIGDVREKVLKSVELLEGKPRYNGKDSCYSAMAYVYGYAGVGSTCVYSDVDNKGYSVGDGIITGAEESAIFTVNPYRCPKVGYSEIKKLNLLQKGDLLSIYFGKSGGKDSPHNVIFLGWKDKSKWEANLFDWNGPGGTYQKFTQVLSDAEHPVYMFWEPVEGISSTGGEGDKDEISDGENNLNSQKSLLGNAIELINKHINDLESSGESPKYSLYLTDAKLQILVDNFCSEDERVFSEDECSQIKKGRRKYGLGGLLREDYNALTIKKVLEYKIEEISGDYEDLKNINSLIRSLDSLIVECPGLGYSISYSGTSECSKKFKNIIDETEEILKGSTYRLIKNSRSDAKNLAYAREYIREKEGTDMGSLQINKKLSLKELYKEAMVLDGASTLEFVHSKNIISNLEYNNLIDEKEHNKIVLTRTPIGSFRSFEYVQIFLFIKMELDFANLGEGGEGLLYLIDKRLKEGVNPTYSYRYDGVLLELVCLKDVLTTNECDLVNSRSSDKLEFSRAFLIKKFELKDVVIREEKNEEPKEVIDEVEIVSEERGILELSNGEFLYEQEYKNILEFSKRNNLFLGDVGFKSRDNFVYEISIKNKDISDISLLKEFSSLENLYLENSNVEDISLLKDLTSLKILSLKNNGLSDISLLGNLASLNRLELGGNKITDVSSLDNLVNLNYLDLEGNWISDISSLRELPRLAYLDVRSNYLSVDDLDNIYFRDKLGNNFKD